MAKQKYDIEDVEIGDKVDFQRRYSDNVYENCEVTGKLDKNLLIINIPDGMPNVIIDISEVIEVRFNKHS